MELDLPFGKLIKILLKLLLCCREFFIQGVEIFVVPDQLRLSPLSRQ